MISFLRKIRNRSLSSRQLSEYLLYALGEVTLVMIGILLALQVNNWNEKNNRNKQYIRVLKTIKADLVADTVFATSVVQFYDTINKYSNKVIDNEYTSNNIEDCLACRSLITAYQPFIVQDKGYLMLKNFSDENSSQNDSLQLTITQFYTNSLEMLEQSNDFIKSETLKNLDYYKTQPWFIDWMKGRFTDELKFYFGEDLDFKNRVALNLILASANHANFVKAHKEGASEIIDKIDKKIISP